MSTNIISLNQLVDLFKSFADRHYFINDFGYGPTSDIGTSRQMDFPYMWLTLDQPSTIRVQNKTTIPDLYFSVLFMDKINIQKNYLDINGVDSDNSQEVLSDMLQLLQDLIVEIETKWGNYGIKIEGDVSCYPAVDETTDKVNGWVGQFLLKIKYANCILPTGDIVQTNISPINPYTRYLTCDTLSNCELIQNIENTLNAANLRLFSQTGDSVTIINTDVETSIIDGGVGTLNVPANGFNIGDSFRVVMSGRLSNLNNTDIRIKLKSGSVILADSGFQSIIQHNNDIYKIETDFTIRNIGGAGTAEIVTIGTFQTTKKNSSTVTGFAYEDTNNTTFDTTIPNTLDITVEWATASTSNSIKSQVFTLTKTY